MIPKETLLAQLLEIVLPHPVGMWNPLLKEFVPSEITPYAFVRAGDDAVHVSAEDGGLFCDFYGEYRGGYPWIHPELVKFAEHHSMKWEWDDPGSISLYEA